MAVQVLKPGGGTNPTRWYEVSTATASTTQIGTPIPGELVNLTSAKVGSIISSAATGITICGVCRSGTPSEHGVLGYHPTPAGTLETPAVFGGTGALDTSLMGSVNWRLIELIGADDLLLMERKMASESGTFTIGSSYGCIWSAGNNVFNVAETTNTLVTLWGFYEPDVERGLSIAAVADATTPRARVIVKPVTLQNLI